MINQHSTATGPQGGFEAGRQTQAGQLAWEAAWKAGSSLLLSTPSRTLELSIAFGSNVSIEAKLDDQARNT